MKMLEPLVLKPLSVREIRPAGWLRRQLEIQAEGLCGNLDRFWPDVKDSRWFGGGEEGWERAPYWLDGLIPLAWLLQDKALQQRAAHYIDCILDKQQADGWLCPGTTQEEKSAADLWALFLILKVLTGYEDVSGETRVQPAVPIAWDMAHGAAAYPVVPRRTGSDTAIRLLPYGCTNLRITEFPLITDDGQ